MNIYIQIALCKLSSYHQESLLLDTCDFITDILQNNFMGSHMFESCHNLRLLIAILFFWYGDKSHFLTVGPEGSFADIRGPYKAHVYVCHRDAYWRFKFLFMYLLI